MFAHDAVEQFPHRCVRGPCERRWARDRRGDRHGRGPLVRDLVRRRVPLVRRPPPRLAPDGDLCRHRRRGRCAGGERLGPPGLPVHALPVRRRPPRRRAVHRRRSVDRAAELLVHGVLRVRRRSAACIRSVANEGAPAVDRVAPRPRARRVGALDPRPRQPSRSRVLPRAPVRIRRAGVLVRPAARQPGRFRRHRRRPARRAVLDDARRAEHARSRLDAASPSGRARRVPRASLPPRRGRARDRGAHARRCRLHHVGTGRRDNGGALVRRTSTYPGGHDWGREH